MPFIPNKRSVVSNGSFSEEAKAKERVEELKSSDRKEANKAADWVKWRQGTHAANTYCLAHALGLQRDPSRGRTHIVFRKVEYTPRVSKDFRYRFRVERCGVFKTQDVLSEIEGLMGLDEGEGKEYINGIFLDLGTSAQGAPGEKVPILDLTFGDGIQTWLGSSKSTQIFSVLEQLRLTACSRYVSRTNPSTSLRPQVA